ncbi:MAG: class I SAM-dependent methyltransferase [Acidobacteria bacterium]|nr:class I SAM-dependent methyltransferase [Acidobacteriota bacterium]
MGWVARELSPLSQCFADYCAAGGCGRESPAVDLGAAYGAAALAALDAGAWLIANDLDATHLEELVRRAPESARDRLTVRVGRFPEALEFGPGSLGAVHASNVFHFLTGNQIRLGLTQIARWLRPGGRLFIQAATPYQAPFTAFISEYETRAARGDRWPGWVERISEFSSHRQLGQMPRSVHLLTAPLLAARVEDAGLVVERAWHFRRPDLPRSLWLDGRESAGVIAHHPGVMR